MHVAVDVRLVAIEGSRLYEGLLKQKQICVCPSYTSNRKKFSLKVLTRNSKSGTFGEKKIPIKFGLLHGVVCCLLVLFACCLLEKSFLAQVL